MPAVQPQTLLLDNEDFETEPQPWAVDKSLRHLPVELVPEPFAEFERIEEPDPAAAGPAPMEVPAADGLPEPTTMADPDWDAPAVRLPGSERPEIGAPVLCDAGPSMAAEPVEAFLPPNPPPRLMPYPAPAAQPLRLRLHAADWEVVAYLADAAPAAVAEPVESLLPAPAEPRAISWPLALPQLQLDAADWLAPTSMAELAAVPAAEAVESFLPAPAEPRVLAWPLAASAPQLKLVAANWVVAGSLAKFAPAPVAESVESLLPAPAEPQMIRWPLALPKLQLAAADWLTASSPAGFATAATAEAAESFLPAPSEPQIVSLPPSAAALPRLAVGPASWVLSVDLAEFEAAPAAQPVEAFLPALPEPRTVTWPTTAAALPSFTLVAADWELAGSVAEFAAVAAAEPVESFLPALPEPLALPLTIAAVELPKFTIAAIEPEPVEEFVPPVVIANASESWMVSPAACEVVREVIPSCAGALPVSIPLAIPATVALAIEPTIRWRGDWRPSAAAEPVISFVAPHLETALASSLPVAVGEAGMSQGTGAGRPQHLAGIAEEQLPQAIEPPQADTPVIAARYQESGESRRLLQFPGLDLEHTTGNRAAAFQHGAPAAAEPVEAQLHADSVTPRLDRFASLQPPQSPAPALRCGFPVAGPKGADFICQPMQMAPIKSLQSMETGVEVLGPRFVVRPVFERVEEAGPAPKPVDKTPAFAEIFEISKAARKASSLGRNRGLFSVGKLIAASLIVGLGMWFGAGSVKIGRQMLAMNTSIRDMGSSNQSAGGENVATTARSFPSPKYSAPKSPTGPIASVRRAIQGRAAVELSDTFRRMETWGANAMTLPAGWTRHPDGYVRTGQLALYRPAQTFTDYRFEFFGQIEKKSMSWAIRAKDQQNYYGMKMTVIEPGLRPVVAMVHYAVVGGKKLQRVQTPLSIMMHNNEPYHVAVDVKGNKVTTSIEGQEVDSWTDDALKMGGIGFFSEVGESARLYWMRVSKNQDWLGRVCAYLSSGSGTNTADLWRDEFPHAPTQPSEPTLPPADVTLAAAEETEEYSPMGFQRARILKIGRTELCRS